MSRVLAEEWKPIQQCSCQATFAIPLGANDSNVVARNVAPKLKLTLTKFALRCRR